MKIRHLPKTIPFTVILSLLLASLAGCGTNLKTETCRETRFLFDSNVYVEVYGSEAQDAGLSALKKMGQLDQALNIYNQNSELARINQAAGKNPVQVSPDTFSVIRESIEVAHLTEGSFNPAIGPMVQLWQKAKKEKTVPAQAEISKLIPLTNYRLIQLNKEESTVFLPVTGMSLDLGGIAKGFAVEQAVAVLKEAGIQSAMVVAGGNIFCLGTKPDGTAWRVGIRDPLNVKSIVGTVQLCNQGVDTAGDYEQYFTVNGKKYGHILDPGTGYPPEGVSSCTVVTDSPSFADASATAIVVMGVEKGLKQLEKSSGTQGMIIETNGTRHYSQGFKELFIASP